MLLSLITSCTPRIIYKTKTEYIIPPEGLIKECKAVDVKDGAKNKDELLKLVSIAYVETLSNMASCNIKTKEAINYINKTKPKH